MIDLKDYFEPLKKDSKNNKLAEGTYGKTCIFKDPFGEGQNFNIALIGIDETRNAVTGTFESDLDQIRMYFYQLAEIPRLKVVDLGNLKLGNSVKDTYASVKDVVEELLKRKIIPLIIGGSQDITVPLVRAFATHNNETELTLIDSRLDNDDHEFHSQSYINRIDAEFSSTVLISLIGYQSYFVNANAMRVAYDKNWNLQRLGAVRNNFNQVEPIFRDSDMVSFDVSAIRQNDCQGASFSSPNGFYAEEACQLSNLAGLSDKLRLFSIFEHHITKDVYGQSAHLIAQIIWHFIFGVSQRKNDFPNKKLESYKKIYVKLEKIDSDLVFYENEQNKRFWVEIPSGKNNKTKIISCSENDYQKACNNEIPDRIWQNVSRYLK
jgi:arginase family enzyme